MIFGVAAVVAHCSRAFTLEPGDVIATGTPAGVLVFRQPPERLHDGDVMTIEIEGIGRLTNPCREVPQAG
jgi:2-keto-4-pentenoate hydratase/2-oxohepta-3-ene-1,7-dioic acid hydratase in catechol pathway